MAWLIGLVMGLVAGVGLYQAGLLGRVLGGPFH